MVIFQITGLQCRLKKYILCVKLEPSSKEFKIVERLFRHTMKDEDVIVEVKRLQNPFLFVSIAGKPSLLPNIYVSG